MSALATNDEMIEQIFRNNLKVESNPMSIETLFTGRLRNRIKYDPYYQRNYVWDRQKATYFIESILMGTEIPPLIFFNRGSEIEVIDGRQRFQTIVRFMDGDFDLDERGLLSMKGLAGLNYRGISDSIVNTFLDTTLRVIEFTIVAADEVDEAQEDMVKKEVFRRYNSGITPLRKAEFQKALYIDDDVTGYFRKCLGSDNEAFQDVVSIFASERDQSRLDDPRLIDEIMQTIRRLLVLHEIPIRYFESARGKEVARIIYDDFSDRNDAELVYSDFQSKVNVLKQLHRTVSTRTAATNRYLYETLYWAVAILEKEGFDYSKVADDEVIENMRDHVENHSHVYDSETPVFRAVIIDRFLSTINFIGDVFNRSNLGDLYVDRKVSINQYRGDVPPLTAIKDVTDLRLNKPDAQSITVENLKNRMHRRRFLVRPPYQRYESISKPKASAIIESMLLGIKLPPIFVFSRKDGVIEVIDGQQRILSILGYMHTEFLDERGEWTRSDKDSFSLNELRILRDLKGKSFEDLDIELQDKLWDFKLYQVTIDEALNPGFEPVDLFIRLNNKPYPVKDNTFEMWNSYVDREIIQKIKNMVSKYASWFYYRKDNKRMDNEHLLTTLAYLEYYDKQGKLMDSFEFFPQGGRIYSRVKSTSHITKLLESISHGNVESGRFLQAIRSVDSYIKKVRTLLIDQNVQNDLDSWLNIELSKLFDTNNRTRNQFYVLWYLLRRINQSMVLSSRSTLRSRIDQAMQFIRNTEEVAEDSAIGFFHGLVDSIWEDHSPDERKLKLTSEEISKRIRSQSNICPLCSNSLFVGDDAEVDHLRPISVGGSDTDDNIQIVHWICNRKKSNKVL